MFLKSNKKLFINISLLIILITLSFLYFFFFWNQQKYVIAYFDAFIPWNPWHNITDFSSVYRESFPYGRIDPNGLNLLPYVLFYALFGNGNLAIAQALWLAINFSLSAFGVYKLLNFIKSKWGLSINQSVIYAVTLFYLFNNFTFIYVWRMQLSYSIFYLILPVFLYLVFKYLTDKKSINIYLLGFIFIQYFLVYGLSHPSQLIILGVFCLLICAVIYFNRKKFHIKWNKVLALLLILFAAHSWWLLPQITNFNYQVENAGNAQGNFAATTTAITAQNTSIPNLARILGQYHYIAPWFDQSVYPEVKNFVSNQSLNIYLSIIPILIILYLTYSSYKHRIKFYLLSGGLLVLILFFSLPSSPFKEIYFFLMEKIPFLSAFRILYEKAGVILLLMYTLVLFFLHHKQKYFIQIFTSFFIILSIIYPLLLTLQAKAIPESEKFNMSARIDPKSNDLVELVNFMNSEPESSRVVIAPLQRGLSSQLSNGNKNTIISHPLALTLHQQVIFGNTGGYVDDLLNIAYHSMLKGDIQPFVNLGVNYIITDKTSKDYMSNLNLGSVDIIDTVLATNSIFKNNRFAVYNISKKNQQFSSLEGTYYLSDKINETLFKSGKKQLLPVSNKGQLYNQTVEKIAMKDYMNISSDRKNIIFIKSGKRYDVPLQTGELVKIENQSTMIIEPGLCYVIPPGKTLKAVYSLKQIQAAGIFEVQHIGNTSLNIAIADGFIGKEEYHIPGYLTSEFVKINSYANITDLYRTVSNLNLLSDQAIVEVETQKVPNEESSVCFNSSLTLKTGLFPSIDYQNLQKIDIPDGKYRSQGENKISVEETSYIVLKNRWLKSMEMKNTTSGKIIQPEYVLDGIFPVWKLSKGEYELFNNANSFLYISVGLSILSLFLATIILQRNFLKYKVRLT